MQQGNEPFIPEVIEGLVRFVVFLLLFAGSVLTFVWRVLTRPLTERIKLLEDALSGKEAKPRLDLLERDTLIMRHNIEGLLASYEKQQEILDEMKHTTQRLDQNIAVLTERIEGKLELLIDRASQRRKEDDK